MNDSRLEYSVCNMGQIGVQEFRNLSAFVELPGIYVFVNGIFDAPACS